jgi:uncharacterized protein
MSRPRVVLDTNVLISAALQPSGLEARLIELAARRAVELCVSPEVLAEYREVLSRPKFARLDPRHVSRLLDLIAVEALAVAPAGRLAESPHEADNRFLECAQEAAADFIVTGNKRHFPKRWKNTTVVNARELLEIVK